MKRLLSIMITLILVLSMATASVLAETETASEAPAVTENAESSGEAFDYSLYPLITEDQAVKLIANAIRNHEKTVRFRVDGYSVNTVKGDDYAEQLLNKAYGDMLEYYVTEGYISPNSYSESRFELGCFEYNFDYTFSKKQCVAFEKELKKVEKSLKLKGLSDKKKALKIYRWITKNVKYDTKAFYYYQEHWESLRNYVEFTAYGEKKKKKAVCQGIACLYYRMLKDAGVDACMISANGPGSSECHTWVLVKIGKKWYNTDPTFDGIEHNKDSRYKYFLKTDKSYKRLKHYLPKKPKKFTKTHPMGKKDLKF